MGEQKCFVALIISAFRVYIVTETFAFLRNIDGDYPHSVCFLINKKQGYRTGEPRCKLGKHKGPRECEATSQRGSCHAYQVSQVSHHSYPSKMFENTLIFFY
jgi:hypothetical protein